MSRTLLRACVLACVSVGSAWWPPALLAQTPEGEVLARVDLTAAVAGFALPAYAWLQDASGQEYLLVICAESRLATSAIPYRILDSDARSDEYVLARPRRPEARTAAVTRYPVVHDDGIRLLLRATPSEAEDLAEMGCSIHRLSPDPIVWQADTSRSNTSVRKKEPFSPDPRIAELISRVDQADLLTQLKRVCGEETVVSGGDPYLIATRHTRSGTPVQKATQLAYERLQALGLNPSFHSWSLAGSSNRNVIGTQPGSTRSNEIVLITAHLDDMPSGSKAPGADDNASGSIAVLTAARLFSQFRFERTVRFILFTGEEQGLLGSYAYAASVAAARDNIVAVFNMDMLAWNGVGGPQLRLHTRTASNPGHTNDLFIARVFTNVVASYGLSNSLSPVITPDADDASDHASFWDKGFTALYAEEDYPGDFNPYYHTVNDTIAHLDLNFFTAYTRAALGTVAHLANLTSPASFGVVEVANSDWTPGSGIGAGLFYAKFDPTASETGADPRDLPLSSAPANPNSKWLCVSSAPYGVELTTDSRPPDGQTVFSARLSVIDTAGIGVSCSNRLRFDFVAPPDSNRTYTAHIHVDGRFAQSASSFDCVTNLLDVVSAGGYVTLPNLKQVTNGTAYGTLLIAITNKALVSVAAGPLLTNGQFWVRFAATPGVNYTIQSSPTLNGPWTTRTNISSGDAGVFEFRDTIAEPGALFYRPVWP